MPSKGFQFQQFYVKHENCAHKVGTDGVLLPAWADIQGAKQILDVGSGSGLIALICAQRLPEAQITGIEQDRLAYEESIENIANSPFKNRVQIIHGDFIKTSFQQHFDTILSNPPFFSGSSSSGILSRDQARAALALPHALLARKSAQLLRPKGSLHLILPKTEAKRFIPLAQQNQLYLTRRCKVYGTPQTEDKRWMLSFSLGLEHVVVEETLYLRNQKLSHTPSYKALTKAFYL